VLRAKLAKRLPRCCSPSELHLKLRRGDVAGAAHVDLQDPDGLGRTEHDIVAVRPAEGGVGDGGGGQDLRDEGAVRRPCAQPRARAVTWPPKEGRRKRGGGRGGRGRGPLVQMLMPSPQQAQRLPLASQRMPSGTPFPSCTAQKVRPLTIAVPPFTTSNTFTLCGSSGWSVRSSSFRLWKKDGRRKTERERWYPHSPSVPLAPESAMYLPPPRPSAFNQHWAPRWGAPLRLTSGSRAG